MNEKHINTDIKGGVIIIGSLFWEDETNCICDQTDKARKRRIWRKENLDLESKKSIPLPIRYGRSSSTRACTYTMVLSRECMRGNGQGLIVPYREPYNFSDRGFLCQIEKLANVEGIKKGCSWGAIAIWINPESKYREIIEKKWRQTQSPKFGHSGSIDRFEWSDDRLINDNYELEGVTIESELDFLVCTYIRPKHKNLLKENNKQYPTPKEIAKEIMSAGYGTYFNLNKKSGIITKDDDEIDAYLAEKQI